MYEKRRLNMVILTAVMAALLTACHPASKQPDEESEGAAFVNEGSVRFMGASGSLDVACEFSCRNGSRLSWVSRSNLRDTEIAKELADLLATFPDVLHEEIVSSAAGTPLGKRLFLRFHPPGKDSMPYFVLWKNRGGQIDRVEGTDLDQVLAFEEWNKYVRD
jgi:hypothetical protein